jgi:uncharacterized protein YuzB (UPF0349 family)
VAKISNSFVLFCSFLLFSSSQVVYGEVSFSQHIIIERTVDWPVSVYSADLDNDGDIDVLSASELDDKIAWYENEGAGFFRTQHVISTDAQGAQCVFAADLDNDGDMDVLSASDHDNKIAWYENDGTGAFGIQQVISTDAQGAQSVYAADLDGDNDLDVLSASFLDNKIEQKGQPLRTKFKLARKDCLCYLVRYGQTTTHSL